MSTTNRKTGVIAQLPRDGKRGIVVSPNGSNEYQLHVASDTRHRETVLLAVGREVTFDVLEALDLRDTAKARQLELEPFEWDVRRDHKSWVLKDRRPIEDPLPAPEVDADGKHIGVVTDVDTRPIGIAGWLTLRDGQRARFTQGDSALNPDKRRRFAIGEEVTCTFHPRKPPAHVSKRQRPRYEEGGSHFFLVANCVEPTGFVVLGKTRVPRNDLVRDMWGTWYLKGNSMVSQ